MIRVNTIAMLDGSIRTVELGTLEAIELCAYTVEHNNESPHAYHTVRHAPNDARKLLSYIESDDDERTTEDARENLECLMYETSNAMHELGYHADWHGGWFYIETIDEGEAE